MTDNPADKFVDIGDPIICHCGITLGRRKDRNTISISKPVRGGPAVHIKAEYHGGPFTITCPKCGFGAIFLNIEETLSVGDGIAPKTEGDTI